MAGEEDVAIDVMGRTYVIEFSIMQQVREGIWWTLSAGMNSIPYSLIHWYCVG